MVIERKDKIVHLIECKFTDTSFEINKKWYDNFKEKIDVFRKDRGKNRDLQFVIISANGCKKSQYTNIVKKILTIDDLFIELEE